MARVTKGNYIQRPTVIRMVHVQSPSCAAVLALIFKKLRSLFSSAGVGLDDIRMRSVVAALLNTSLLFVFFVSF